VHADHNSENKRKKEHILELTIGSSSAMASSDVLLLGAVASGKTALMRRIIAQSGDRVL